MKRIVEPAPLRSSSTTTPSPTLYTTEKPDYVPVFSMLKRGKYASYITIYKKETRQWHVHLCEREDCAHARIHLCLFDLQTSAPKRPPCARCGSAHNLSWHHIYPQRFFKRNRIYMQARISLCRGCHDSIETTIPQKRPLQPQEYVRIATTFVRST
ncbi:MAG: hypothetical protein RI911_208 [Candidatus Parcubacteria bacterium]|jgi:hypothetical protein